MTSNASELMRLMVIRSPEPAPEAVVLELNPSDGIRRAGPAYHKAREELGKALNETTKRFTSPGQVPQASNLQALIERSSLELDTLSPKDLVKDVFGRPANEVIAGADWKAATRKLSDSIIYYKLAYREGPRPLPQLASLYRAMMAVAAVADENVDDQGKLRAILAAPLRLPPPFQRTSESLEASRMEARREKAFEGAVEKVKLAISAYEEEQSIGKALAELTSVDISPANFVAMDAATLSSGGAKRTSASSGPTQRGAAPAGADEDKLAANWEVRRAALSSGATGLTPAPGGTGLALTPAAVKSLSSDTKKLVANAGLELTGNTIEYIAASLAAKRETAIATREKSLATTTSLEGRAIGGVNVSKSVRTMERKDLPPRPLPTGVKLPTDIKIHWDDLLTETGWPGSTPDPVLPPETDLGPSLLLPAGVGQLYVIRQQITGYRSGEISHVENVLPGETRERHHRRLRQQEITSTQENEREQEDEKTLQTTNRSELEREVQATIKRQFNMGASAEVSGDYGKVEFTASGQVQSSTASESASKTAQRVATEVVETSRQRVTERVRTERIQRTLEELEETNLHKFSGEKLTEPLVGVYQWIDKLYLNEIWSYGTRTMYEVIVPEPASALIAAAMAPEAPKPTLVERPPALTVPIEQLTPVNVHKLCVTYGVTEDIEPYPESFLANVAFTHASDKDAHDNFYAETKEIDVPDGYEPVDGWIVVRARGEDQTPMIGVTVGKASGGFHTDNLVQNSQPSNAPIYFHAQSWPNTANIDKLQVAIAADDYSSMAVSVLIQLRPSQARIDKWKRGAYAAIRGAYDARLGEWRDYQSQIDFEAPDLSEKLLANNPSANRITSRHELQRGAIEIFRNLSLDFDLINEGSATHAIPRIDFPSVAEASPEILFLSQAFEWHNMTYVLYPYFFGRRPEWASKMMLESVDYNFVEFLKSGAARVQVPVRPGFEAAVDHYMITREPFFGRGMPQIGDELYLPYVDEARDAAGAALGGTHLPELDFEVSVPTTLVVARNGEKLDVTGGTLPRWAKVGDKWEEA